MIKDIVKHNKTKGSVGKKVKNLKVKQL